MKKTDTKRGGKGGLGEIGEWRKEIEARRTCDNRITLQCIRNHNIKMIPENNQIILLVNLTTLHCAFHFFINRPLFL